MQLTESQMRILLEALDDAISDRISFVYAHDAPHGQKGVMAGYEDIVKRSQRQIKRYKKLRADISKKLTVK